MWIFFPCIILQFVGGAPFLRNDGEGGLAGGPPCRVVDASFLEGERAFGPRPHEQIDTSSLPVNWFWGDVNGTNYLTVPRNQHIPNYCGSCWAMSATSSVSDRIKILRKGQHPEVLLAPQVLINCGGGGTCRGGDPAHAYHYMAVHGLPDESCQNYEAVNGKCSPFGACETCEPGTPPAPEQPGTCTPVVNYTRYYVDEYGYTSGGGDRDLVGRHVDPVTKMKAEIFARGPISCGMHVTSKFEHYNGGIYEQFAPMSALLNHEIAVVGWGEAGSLEFWIGRNSWGKRPSSALATHARRAHI